MLLVGTSQFSEVCVEQVSAALSAHAPVFSRAKLATQTQLRALALLRSLLLDNSARRALRCSGGVAARLKEATDGEKVSNWACELLSSTIRARSTRPTLFADVTIPMLQSIAFKGRDQEFLDMITAFQEYTGFLRPDAHDSLLRSVTRKSKIGAVLEKYELEELWPKVRAAITLTLTARRFDYAAMPFVVAFANAACFVLWLETKATLLQRVGSVPT